MIPEPPSVSIVINTLNRGSLLRQAIESFDWLKYDGEFEVIVVNGPSTDNSAEVIDGFGARIKAASCEVANLSVSRNIGICMAEGDVVAFIDDDAVPEPEWLTQLTAPYIDPSVGGSGGLVYNHTGYEFQYRYCLMDRLGNPDLSPDAQMPHLSFPASSRFPHLLGCNSSFRRKALLEIGGFDEEYEYFLDESDVCLRLVDAGYIISQVGGAYVHHKYAPSNIRGENKIPKYRFPVIKNKIYFTLKHSRDFYSFDEILDEHRRFISKQRDEVGWAVDNGLLEGADAKALETDIERAQEIGMKRGLEGVKPEAMITKKKIATYSFPFKSFQPISVERPLTLVLVSKDYPPAFSGGIAIFTYNLAKSLAKLGHIVHVITTSPDINRVDFEDGVWVHRMVVEHSQLSAEATRARVPQHIWNWSATALKEAKRIGAHRKIDTVEAPIWDCEGVAFLFAREWPLITSLHTTLAHYLDSATDRLIDHSWMQDFGKPMLALEERLVMNADAIRANSVAIRREFETRYRCQIPDEMVRTIPHGLSDVTSWNGNKELRNLQGKTILFVGRLEPRKGIDTALAAAAVFLELVEDASLRIIGDDTLAIPGQSETYRQRFQREFGQKSWAQRVSFEGRVSDETLHEAYATCDIFIAPSTFESLGLIFLEAMQAGKPVIGCRAGGMPEVIRHGETGYLIDPGNSQDLAMRVVELLDDRELLTKMGAAARQDFEARFTSDRMASDTESLVDLALRRNSQSGKRATT